MKRGTFRLILRFLQQLVLLAACLLLLLLLALLALWGTRVDTLGHFLDPVWVSVQHSSILLISGQPVKTGMLHAVELV